MAKIRAGKIELDTRRLDSPFFGQISPSVPTITFFAIETRVGAQPFALRKLRRPKSLRTRAREEIFTKSLEFSAVPGIYKLVIHKLLVALSALLFASYGFGGLFGRLRKRSRNFRCTCFFLRRGKSRI